MNGQASELGSAPDQFAELVGIIELEPCGDVAAQGDWAIVGSVIVRGLVLEVMPRLNLDPLQRHMLFLAACQVWLRGCMALHGWRYWPGLGYVAGVEVRRPAERSFLCAAASARWSSGSTAPRTASGSSVPSGR